MADYSSSTSGSSEQRKRCGHCDQYLTPRVYKRHKNLYYDASRKEWNRLESSGGSEDEEERLQDLLGDPPMELPEGHSACITPA